MSYRLRIALAVLASVATGCGQGAPIEGQLSFIEPSNRDASLTMQLDGSTLWWIEDRDGGGADLYRASFEDPRRPDVELVRNTLGKSDGFYGRSFLVNDGVTYVLNEETLEIGGERFDTPRRALGMVSVSDTVLALATAQIVDSSPERKIVFVDLTASMAADTLVVVGEALIDWVYWVPSQIHVDDGRLFTCSFEGDVEIYDVTDPTTPTLLHRAKINVPIVDLPVLVAARGDALFFYSYDGEDLDYHIVSWFRVDGNATTLVPISITRDLMPLGGFDRTSSHVLVSTRGLRKDGRTPHARTIAYRVDGSEELLMEGSVGAPPKFVPGGGVAAYEGRGLLFVSGNGIQVLDLGFVSTREPSWP